MPTMSTTTPFTLKTPANTILDGLVDLPDPQRHPGPRPAVVICHGFKGFMEWSFFPYLGTLLAERGIVAVRFNLSGSGMRPGEDRVGDPEAFRADTHSLEVGELLAVLAATGTEIAAGQVDTGRIGLLGHSRGGGNAILASAREPWRDRLRALVTWAAVATFDRYSPEQKEAWRRDGELPVVNARTGQQLALGLGLLEDLETHRAELDILAAAAGRRAPWLIIHGGQDESVSVADGEQLASVVSHGASPGAAPPAELLILPEANHTFGSRHPFAGPSPSLTQALNATQRWFLRHL
jgi:dienelactone hydrolase